jgi:hypothetical protein
MIKKVFIEDAIIEHDGGLITIIFKDDSKKKFEIIYNGFNRSVGLAENDGQFKTSFVSSDVECQNLCDSLGMAADYYQQGKSSGHLPTLIEASKLVVQVCKLFDETQEFKHQNPDLENKEEEKSIRSMNDLELEKEEKKIAEELRDLDEDDD